MKIFLTLYYMWLEIKVYIKEKAYIKDKFMSNYNALLALTSGTLIGVQIQINGYEQS